jgi:EspG family
MTTITPRRTPPNTVVLSPTELLACWEALTLGEPPPLLRLRRPGLTHTTQRHATRFLATALDRLGERGLSHDGQPAAALARMLGTLAHADYHLDIRYSNPTGSGRPVLGIGAATETCGVILLSADGAGPFQLWPSTATAVAPTLLAMLGDVPAGRGPSVNIPTTVLEQAIHANPDASIWALADQLRARGISSAESSALAHMCTDVNFGGQLGATARYGGPDRRGPWIIGFHRQRAGGYFMQLRRSGTLTMCPTTTCHLLRQWRTLINHLPRPIT